MELEELQSSAYFLRSNKLPYAHKKKHFIFETTHTRTRTHTQTRKLVDLQSEIQYNIQSATRYDIVIT